MRSMVGRRMDWEEMHAIYEARQGIVDDSLRPSNCNALAESCQVQFPILANHLMALSDGGIVLPRIASSPGEGEERARAPVRRL